jgi:ABC-type branched-subunit amino acid transport system ATPase component
MILQLQNISKSFDGLKAVDNVSLGFEKAKVTGLIGPNGAGKTTLFHLITGFLKPDHGEIRCQGKRIDGLKPWQIAKAGIGRLFQDVRIFAKLTVLDNVLSAFAKQTGENPLASLFLLRRINQEEKERKKEALRWLEFVGLVDYADVLAENLSYGQQKLLAISRLLAAHSQILLLDEPTAGISPQMVPLLLSLIRQLAEQGKTIVLIEHNMNVIADVSDFVYFMADGKLLSAGPTQDVLDNPEVRKRYIYC